MPIQKRSKTDDRTEYQLEREGGKQANTRLLSPFPCKKTQSENATRCSRKEGQSSIQPIDQPINQRSTLQSTLSALKHTRGTSYKRKVVNRTFPIRIQVLVIFNVETFDTGTFLLVKRLAHSPPLGGFHALPALPRACPMYALEYAREFWALNPSMSGHYPVSQRSEMSFDIKMGKPSKRDMMKLLEKRGVSNTCDKKNVTWVRTKIGVGVGMGRQAYACKETSSAVG